MGDVGDELFLVVFRPGDLTGHVGQGSRKISHLVIAFHVQLIVHVSGCVFFGGPDDLPKGSVNDLGKEDQDDQGKKEEDQKNDIGDIQIGIRFFRNNGPGTVNDYVAPGLVSSGDRSQYAEVIFIKVGKELSHRKVASACDRRVKVFHHHFLIRIRLPGRIDDDTAGGIHDPDLALEVDRNGFQLSLGAFQGYVRIVKVRGIGLGDLDSFGIHVAGRPVPCRFRHKRRSVAGDHDKAQDAEDHICKNKFQINCFAHGSAFEIEFVADAPDGRDLPALMVLDFFPEPLDVDIDSPCISRIVIAPDLVQKLFSGKDTARSRCQEV